MLPTLILTAAGTPPSALATTTRVAVAVLAAVATPATGWLWWRTARTPGRRWRWTQAGALTGAWIWTWSTIFGLHWPPLLSVLVLGCFAVVMCLSLYDDQQALRRSRADLEQINTWAEQHRDTDDDR